MRSLSRGAEAAAIKEFRTAVKVQDQRDAEGENELCALAFKLCGARAVDARNQRLVEDLAGHEKDRAVRKAAA